MTFSLKLFGGLTLESDHAPVQGPVGQRHRLALLALLATARGAGGGGRSRDKLVAWLWPERDTAHARALLNQAVHVLRRTLGAEAIRAHGEELQLNPDLVRCDVVAYEAAVAAVAWDRAAALYAGPFLDGFFLSEAPEFERWVDQERERLAGIQAKALEGLAEQAESAGDRRGAVDRWQARVSHDPFDSRAVVRLMLALDAAGNRAAALRQAATHQHLLREELDIEPSPEVRDLADRLRAAPIVGLAPRELEWGTRSPATDAVPVPRGGAINALPPPPPPQRYRLVSLMALAGVAAVLLWLQVLVPTRRGPTTEDASTQAVARELARRNGGDALHPAPWQQTRSIPAYELYLRANDPAGLRSDSAARRALEDFRHAVALDPAYAAAWAGIARLTLRVAHGTGGPSSDSAEAAALRAIALDDSLAEAHGTLALVRMDRHDLTGMETHLLRAIALDPTEAQYHEWLLRLYVWRNQGTEALQEAERALALTPLSPSANAEMARALWVNGRTDDALARLESLAGLDPPLQRVPFIAVYCYVRKGMWESAVAILRPQAEQGIRQAVGLYGYLLARAGRRDDARRLLASLTEEHGRSGGHALSIALVQAGLGREDDAMTWLDQAVDDAPISPFTEAGPTIVAILDGRPGDPRARELRRRMGLPGE